MTVLESIFIQSLTQFFQAEATNIANGVSERNLCSRLAIILEKTARKYKAFERYFADVEYNRKQNGEIKSIFDGELRVVRITCDLILHSRGENIENDNLIAIEMKKSERPEQEKNDDRNRLSALTKSTFGDGIWSNDGTTHPEHVCGYKFGYFIEIDSSQRTYLIEKFVEGKVVDVTRGSFRTS